METKIIDTHPSLKNKDKRFELMLESLLDSFQIEGICFSKEELLQIVNVVEAEIKK